MKWEIGAIQLEISPKRRTFPRLPMVTMKCYEVKPLREVHKRRRGPKFSKPVP
jgi:hypothetical protein